MPRTPTARAMATVRAVRDGNERADRLAAVVASDGGWRVGSEVATVRSG